MRAIFTYLPVLSFFLLVFSSNTIQAQDIEWISWQEAVELAQAEGNSKKVFVDVYTDWCGWCKVMDKKTFQNPEVAAYMQEHYYMVKLDAEGKEPIEYDGNTFKYVPSGRRGYHELAAALLQNRMSYPTTVFLDENLKMLSPVPGFQKPEPFLKIARYFGDDIYKTQDWKAYDKASK